MIFRSVSNTNFRARVCTLLLVSSTVPAFTAAPVWTLDINDVISKAKDLAGDKYSAPTSNLLSEFSEMKSAGYQQICSINERTYWGKLKTPFKLSFYHQDIHFDTPVKINEVTAITVKSIKYDHTEFDFGSLEFDEDAIKDLGYAGFRVLYPINKADKQDGVATLFDTSYFRVAGKGQVYGLLARDLAIDTALPPGEEFPRFRELQVGRLKTQDKQLVIYTLPSPSRATGAYRFALHPDKDAVMDVQARVFLRGKVSKLGLAPLTSMYLFGSNQPSEQRSFRPELHDSGGLQIHIGNGGWLWHPLDNPKHLSVSTSGVENLKGFGLFQHSRGFSRYEDLDNRYDLHPSAWIEPKGGQGKDTVELVETPTPDETSDNIVAFWDLETQPKVGKPLDLAYRLYWTMNEDELHDPKSSWVKQTVCSVDDMKQKNLIRQRDGNAALVADLKGPTSKDLTPDAPMTTRISTDSNTEVVESNLRYNPTPKGWRLTLRIKIRDSKESMEIRAVLADEIQKPLSEIWSYQLPADE